MLVYYFILNSSRIMLILKKSETNPFLNNKIEHFIYSLSGKQLYFDWKLLILLLSSKGFFEKMVLLQRKCINA